VSPQLWHQLSRLKIDVLKLSEDSLPLLATYSAGRTIVDRETSKEIGLGCTLNASGDGFLQDRFACVLIRRGHSLTDESKAHQLTSQLRLGRSSTTIP
jgi:hypothetical protein